MDTVVSIASRCREVSITGRKVVVPVAGAFNAEIGPLSTGHAHNRKLRKLLELAGVDIAHTVTPRKLGVVGNVEDAYEQFAQDVDTALAPYGQNHHRVIVGHSYGGLLGLRYHAQHGSAGIITLGSPHGHMREVPYMRKLLRHVEPYHRRCAEYEEFSQDTLALLEQHEDKGNIVFAGSTIDPIVSVSASTPAVSGVRRVLFGPDLVFNIPRSHQNVTRIPGLVEHARLLTDHTVGEYVLRHVAEMMDPLINEPIPDNVIRLRVGNSA